MTTPRCKKQGEEEEEAAHYPPATYRWMTAVLVGGHLAETAVQLFLVLHYWPLCGRWAAGLAVLLATAVVVINAASIVAVRRGLDFTDRWFGQCLCYVMHVSLLALVWRFLKLTFLYDRADLREFALLRFIQVTFNSPSSFKYSNPIQFNQMKRNQMNSFMQLESIK